MYEQKIILLLDVLKASDVKEDWEFRYYIKEEILKRLGLNKPSLKCVDKSN